MRISPKLNLVIQLEREGGSAYVHVTPLHREVFEQYFMVLGQTFNSIYSEGVGLLSAPRIAKLMLKRCAIAAGLWEGEGGVEKGLLAEIQRCASMISLGPTGWDQIPLYEAVKRGLLDEDDVAEVEGQATFFIVASAMHKRSDLPNILAFAGRYWDAQTSSLSSMEFAKSLPISTTDEDTEARETASSIPS